MPGAPLILRVNAAGFLLVHAVVIETIQKNVERGPSSREAGGIFLGSYRGPHIEISSCTEPMPADLRSRYRFDRRDKGHQAMAMARWMSSQKTDTFVGEWHSHPEPIPKPSMIDRRTWSSIMRRSQGPFVFAIAGWEAIHWYFGTSTALTQVFPA